MSMRKVLGRVAKKRVTQGVRKAVTRKTAPIRKAKRVAQDVGNHVNKNIIGKTGYEMRHDKLPLTKKPGSRLSKTRFPVLRKKGTPRNAPKKR